MKSLKRRRRSKAQSSLEYVLIIGALLVVTIPLFYYVIHQSTTTLRPKQADDTVHALAAKTESVFFLSEGTKDHLWISIPGGISSTRIANKSITLFLSSGGEITAFTRANITGSIPSARGTYRISVEKIDNYVYVGLVNDTTIPKVITTSPTGIVRITNPLLSATTDEPSRCKYSPNDVNYDSMGTFFVGTGISHTFQLFGQSAASY